VGGHTSKLAIVTTVPINSSVISLSGLASFMFISLMASFLWRSCWTCRSLGPFTSMPYSAHVASVACRRPASVEMKDHHVCLALMAMEFLRGPDLSVMVSLSCAGGRLFLTELEESVERGCAGDWQYIERVKAMDIWVRCQ
jgi:hypothetical protein